MTAKTAFKTVPRRLPVDLADVALIDAPTCAAAGGMSLSWWHDEVRAGRAPAPVIRKPRCTRWRLADVCHFWRESAESAADTRSAEQVTAQARKASAQARAKRAAKAAATPAGQ